MYRTCGWIIALAIGWPTALLAQERSVLAPILNQPALGERAGQPIVSAPEGELPLLQSPAGDLAPPSGSAGAYLGVTFDPRIGDAAVAQAVQPGSPAEQAGLRPGDTIEAINGRPIASNQDVLDIVRTMRAGDLLDIELSRRVRIRTQAALDSRQVPSGQAPQPTGENLPAPPTPQIEIEVERPSYDNTANDAARQNPSGAAADGRRTNSNRDDRQIDRGRGYRVRGLLPRRRN